MTEQRDARILVVDDDENLLAAIKRRHRKQYAITTACGAEEALRVISDSEPFTVVVSDYQMPGMDGVTFLRRVRDASPSSVRIMLTGNAQYNDAIEAVNRGQIFRFLTKPCADDVFSAGLDAAIEQFELKRAERVLLEQTLRGSVQVLIDTLSLVNPVAFGKATRIHCYARQLVAQLGLEDPWKYETAALLSQMGSVATPLEVLQAVDAGQELTPEQEQIVNRQPRIAHDLLAKIPRLEPVARMILDQLEVPDIDDTKPVSGGQILGVAIRFDALISTGASRSRAIGILKSQDDRFDSRVVEALHGVELPDNNTTVRCLGVTDLRIGMILDEDVKNKNDALVVAHGHKITQGTLERLRNYAQLGSIPDTIRVRVPIGGGVVETVG